MLQSCKEGPSVQGTDHGSSPFRVLLADDNPNFLDAVETFLGQYKQFVVVGRARFGKEAIDLAGVLNPHVVLVDVAMPDLNGFEVARRLRTRPASPRIVVLSLYHQHTYHDVAKLVGADRFVPKNAVGTELIPILLELLAETPAARGHES